MTPDQATALRDLITFAMDSAIATDRGEQLPKPGRIGHAAQCRFDLSDMIDELTDTPTTRRVDIANIFSVVRISADRGLEIEFTDLVAASQFESELK